jgi:hypothetical protein
MAQRKAEYYRGVRKAPYDLLKEFLVVTGVMTLLVLVLAIVFSSPDEPPLTLQSVAHDTPLIYAQTSLDELDGNSGIAGYGPPYNNGTGSVQFIGPVSLQKIIGVHIPINTAQDYVLGPLSQAATTDPALKAALDQYNHASAKQQTVWTTAYNTALGKAKENPPNLTVPASASGPVALMMSRMLQLGQSGSMDGLLLTNGHFYQTDFTRPLLFMQNDAVANHAAKFNLLGSTWGVMNETGNYPGQAWLWLYTLWYQIPPYTTAWAANTDALAILTTTILSLILMFLPWIPVLNRIPRYVPVYRLIWKDYYREQRAKIGMPPTTTTPTPTKPMVPTGE